jgi:hypothetical protein
MRKYLQAFEFKTLYVLRVLSGEIFRFTMQTVKNESLFHEIQRISNPCRDVDSAAQLVEVSENISIFRNYMTL